MSNHDYRLEWDAGAFAELDVFLPDVSPELTNSIGYQLRYTPPFRSTFRPRVRELGLTAALINELVGEGVSRLTRIVNAGGRYRDGANRLGDDNVANFDQTTQEMMMLGRRLLSILEERRNILNDLRTGVFLTIGMDEGLLTYPWELMYDDDFFCLKHKIGRVVNAPGADPPNSETNDLLGNRLKDFRILLIEVSRTVRRPDYQYEPLPRAREEAEAIQKILQDSAVGVECVWLSNEEARRNDVLDMLYAKDKKFKILHFCGHSVVDHRKPGNSSLVLYDYHLPASLVIPALRSSRPVFCFINACRSADAEMPATALPRVYTLGQAFLQTGAYFMGSWWNVSDMAAKVFAVQFYTSLLRDAKPLGEAIRLARRECKDRVKTDPGWAAFVYYGDPRIKFERSQTGTKEGKGEQEEKATEGEKGRAEGDKGTA